MIKCRTIWIILDADNGIQSSKAFIKQWTPKLVELQEQKKSNHQKGGKNNKKKEETTAMGKEKCKSANNIYSEHLLTLMIFTNPPLPQNVLERREVATKERKEYPVLCPNLY